MYCSIPRHTGIGRTLTFTETTVSTNSSGGCELTGAGSRVHGDRLLDDEAICNELADGLTGVGVGDLAGLIGIEPNLALSAAYDGGRQALLGGEIDPIERIEVSICLRVYDASCADQKVGRERSKAPNRNAVAGNRMAYILTLSLVSSGGWSSWLSMGELLVHLEMRS